MNEIEEGYQDTVSLEQLFETLTREDDVTEVQIAVVPKQREQVPGEELAKHRVRLSFEFDVVCNTGPIVNSHDDQDMKAYDLALLKSLLQTPQVLDMMADKAASELAYHPEAFTDTFLPQLDTNPYTLFKTAIERLEGADGEYWRDIRDEPIPVNRAWEALLNICTENVYECVDAQFVQSAYELVASSDAN